MFFAAKEFIANIFKDILQLLTKEYRCEMISREKKEDSEPS